MRDKKVFNVLTILKRLKDNQEICTKNIAKELDVDVRTIQRYLKDISEFFDVELITTKRGCYKFLSLENVILDEKASQEFDAFARILTALDEKVLEVFNVNKKLIRKIVKEEIFFVKNSPIEEIKNFKFIKELIKAIKYSLVIDIEYEAEEKYFFKELKPYKIVFTEGNWYLVVESNDDINNGVKFLRLSFIKSVYLSSKSFYKKKEIIDYIYSFQSLMSGYNKKKIKVEVKVDKKVARFFKVKKFLSSQKIVKEEKDAIFIEYYVTNKEEILFLAKRWLPYMKILSPKEYNDELIKIVKTFLKENNEVC
jgi:predicted DNA-binding transcriptional regulator YafY